MRKGEQSMKNTKELIIRMLNQMDEPTLKHLYQLIQYYFLRNH